MKEVMQYSCKSNLREQAKIRNKKAFNLAINEIKKMCLYTVLYIETTNQNQFLSSSSIAIINKDTQASIIWFTLSGNEVLVNHFRYPNKMGRRHYCKRYDDIKTNDCIKLLEHAKKNPPYSPGIVVGTNCKDFAFECLEAAKLKTSGLKNAFRRKPGASSILKKLTPYLITRKNDHFTFSALINNSKSESVPVKGQILKTIDSYIKYREKGKHRLSFFGGCTRENKVGAMKKIQHLLSGSSAPVELGKDEYRALTQGRVGNFIKLLENSHQLVLDKIKQTVCLTVERSENATPGTNALHC